MFRWLVEMGWLLLGFLWVADQIEGSQLYPSLLRRHEMLQELMGLLQELVEKLQELIE